VELVKADLPGKLIIAENIGGLVRVTVNVEHGVIQKALLEKPYNRALLLMGVTREIAALIAASPELQDTILKAEQREELITAESAVDRERIIHRWLLDASEADKLVA
jgi:hypothetical protein